jgi:murein L,D-transpeptidase YcbB/YkuD
MVHRTMLGLLVLLAPLGLLAASAPLKEAVAGWRGEGSMEAATVSAEVSLSDRTLRVMSGENVVASYPIAIGKAGHPTPQGTFRISRIIWNPSWVPPDEPWARDQKATPPGDPKNPMGRVKIFFRAPDYYIHGTSDESSIGRAASHGCIRMRNDDVIALARLLMENGGQPRDASWFRRVINRVTETREVRLTAPITIRIRA